MQIAIHHRPGSFSEKWIEYCKNKELPYQLVNLFDSNIIEKLRWQKVSHLLFHFGTGEYKTDLVLKSLTYLLQKEGIKCFPCYDEYWHYDDKIKQKYLFEKLEIPHVPMHIFYQKESALNWINQEADYPFVFKLSKGAGSSNVILIRSKKQALKMAKSMFGKGVMPVRSILQDFETKVKKHNLKKDWLKVLYRAPRTLMRNMRSNAFLPPEKGYFLVQEFCAHNDFDTRVAVIGKKIFAFRRLVRRNDFRASGSGLIDYNPEKIDRDMLRIALEGAQKIGGASLAFDFVYDKSGSPKILEVSYCYAAFAIPTAGGYWTENLEYHRHQLYPEEIIIESLIQERY